MRIRRHRCWVVFHKGTADCKNMSIKLTWTLLYEQMVFQTAWIGVKRNTTCHGFLTSIQMRAVSQSGYRVGFNHRKADVVPTTPLLPHLYPRASSASNTVVMLVLLIHMGRSVSRSDQSYNETSVSVCCLCDKKRLPFLKV